MENNIIDTKIADMSGQPFVCVHQTQSIFDEFDDEHMGSGNFGPGHYFCIEANYWDGFGVGGLENKNCYLIMQNPYDNSKKVSMKDVIKLAHMEDYVKELQANGGRINLNYKDTLRRVIDELFFTNLSYVVGLGINTNDNEMFAWKDQVWGKVVDGLKQQGYDGLVEKTPLSKGVIVVAWSSNSICQVPGKTKKPQITESNFKRYAQMKDVIAKAMFEMKKHYNEQISESIAYAEMNDDEMMVILHNPTRKELKDNDLDDECRLVYDGNNGYYFASSVWTHEQIEQKLQAKNLPYAETSGEFYYYQDNLFATRDDWSSEEEYQEYKNDWYQSLKSMPYIVKNFGNFKVEIFKGEYLSEEYEGLNRLAGFYWFDENKFQMLKRKPIGVKKLDPEDNEFDYYHLDDNGLEEDNKARFGIEKIGKKVVCYIEAEDKQKCLIAKKAIQRKFNDILIDKFQLSWGRNNFAELDESIAYAERSDDYYDDSEYQDMTNVILKNPSRKELEECGMIECRIAQDWDGNFYFANSYDMIHTDIVEKLESENIKSVETNLFYDTNSNTFYYNVGHLTDGEIEKFSEREEKYLRQSLYISKTFKDFHFKITFGEI